MSLFSIQMTKEELEAHARENGVEHLQAIADLLKHVPNTAKRKAKVFSLHRINGF